MIVSIKHKAENLEKLRKLLTSKGEYKYNYKRKGHIGKGTFLEINGETLEITKISIIEMIWKKDEYDPNPIDAKMEIYFGRNKIEVHENDENLFEKIIIKE